MTKFTKKKLSRERSAACHTEVRADQDLAAALTEIVLSQSGDALHRLAETVENLRREFDPASVTMSTTNIPDAVTKLSAVLAETNRATAKVFELVEHQKHLLGEGDDVLRYLSMLAEKDAVDADALLTAITRYKRVHRDLGAAAHEIVIAQEFQDISGQKVKKVMKLIADVEVYLRTLLSHLKVSVPSAHTTGEVAQEADLDQTAADDILKDFGL
jgi:chemotaxis protein CheZ